MADDDSGNDLLPPAIVVAPVPAPAPGRRSLTCEFCECRLTANGDVLTVSDKAKKFRKHDETIDDLREQLAKSERELTEARAQIPPKVSADKPRTIAWRSGQ